MPHIYGLQLEGILDALCSMLASYESHIKNLSYLLSSSSLSTSWSRQYASKRSSKDVKERKQAFLIAKVGSCICFNMIVGEPHTAIATPPLVQYGFYGFHSVPTYAYHSVNCITPFWY